MIFSSTKSKALRLQEWTGIKLGNYVEYNYYTAVDPGNPTGNANLKEIKYFEKDGELKHHISFTWNGNDDIVKQENIL